MDFQAILSDGWIQSAEWYSSIDSTNSLLKREVSSQNIQSDEDPILQSLPRLIVSEEQTAGRGRGEHAWWSPVGCLMSSIALHLEPSIRLPLPYLVAIAIAKTVESQIENPKLCKIKWPNDVFVGDLKIAGALIECIPYRSKSICIVGSGINVDMDFSLAPIEVRNRATCISRLASDGVWNRRDRMQSTLHHFIKEFQNAIALSTKDPSWWYSQWNSRCYLTGKKIEATVSGWYSESLASSTKETRASDSQEAQQSFVSSQTGCVASGTCLGLDKNGHLRIRHESGKIGDVVSGSIRIL